MFAAGYLSGRGQSGLHLEEEQRIAWSRWSAAESSQEVAFLHSAVNYK